MLKYRFLARILLIGALFPGGSLGEFTATIKSDMVKWGKVFKDAGIRDE